MLLALPKCRYADDLLLSRCQPCVSVSTRSLRLQVILSIRSHCSKYHEMREKHKAKLCRTKQRLEEEMSWRSEKISNLERELSLCSHSLEKVHLHRWLVAKC